MSYNEGNQLGSPHKKDSGKRLCWGLIGTPVCMEATNSRLSVDGFRAFLERKFRKKRSVLWFASYSQSYGHVIATKHSVASG